MYKLNEEQKKILREEKIRESKIELYNLPFVIWCIPGVLYASMKVKYNYSLYMIIGALNVGQGACRAAPILTPPILLRIYR